MLQNKKITVVVLLHEKLGKCLAKTLMAKAIIRINNVKSEKEISTQFSRNFESSLNIAERKELK